MHMRQPTGTFFLLAVAVDCTPISFNPATLFLFDLLTKFESPEYFPDVSSAGISAESVCNLFPLLRKVLQQGDILLGCSLGW